MAVLLFVLPAVKELYGPFWSAIVAEMKRTGAESDLYALHANLSILSLLRKSYMLESNDDLLDAWNENKTAVANWLVDLLLHAQGKHPASFACIEESCPYVGYNSASRKDPDASFVNFSPLLMT